MIKRYIYICITLFVITEFRFGAFVSSSSWLIASLTTEIVSSFDSTCPGVMWYNDNDDDELLICCVGCARL